MANKHQEMQSIIRMYRHETGETEVDMHAVAKFAVERLRWPFPKPVDPYDRLTTQFSQAARVEVKYDAKTGHPYRVNHAIAAGQGDNRQLSYLWFDLDEIEERPKVVKSLTGRRQQMVGDALQLALDADHWNNVHSNEEPIQIPMDFTDDVEWAMNAPVDKAS